jgi:hypothetical protein
MRYFLALIVVGLICAVTLLVIRLARRSILNRNSKVTLDIAIVLATAELIVSTYLGILQAFPGGPLTASTGPSVAVSETQTPETSTAPSTDPPIEPSVLPGATQPDQPTQSDVTSSPSDAATVSQPLRYNNVGLLPLCDSDDCSGTQQVGSKIFAYTDEAEADIMPNYWKHSAFQQSMTSCKSLTVQFAGDEWAQNDGNATVDYLKFIQESAAPVYATVGVGKVGTVHVPLDGGPLIIDAAVMNDPGVHNSDVLIKATGSGCKTPDGVTSN